MMFYLNQLSVILLMLCCQIKIRTLVNCNMHFLSGSFQFIFHICMYVCMYVCILFILFYFINPHLSTFFSLHLEREEEETERERETSMCETNIDWFPFVRGPIWDQTRNLGKCPTGNRTRNPLVYRNNMNYLSHNG